MPVSLCGVPRRLTVTLAPRRGLILHVFSQPLQKTIALAGCRPQRARNGSGDSDSGSGSGSGDPHRPAPTLESDRG